MSSKSSLSIHATNVVGLGARTVAEALLRGMSISGELEDISVQLHLPDIPFWRENALKITNWEIVFEKRYSGKLSRLVSRLWDCLVAPAWLKNSTCLIVLGDIPLRFKGYQVVLLHNQHIIPPKWEGNIRFNFFYFPRLIFRLNQSFGDKFIVQTDLMASELAEAYPKISKLILIKPMPEPSWLKNHRLSQISSGTFTMFYPATKKLPKNHQLIAKMDSEKPYLDTPVRLLITITKEEFIELGGKKESIESWIQATGSLDNHQMVDSYSISNALFFPSLNESYGFPLVEAMRLGLIIICADLPYAKWMCAEEAIYFNPASVKSAWAAVAEAVKRNGEGWRPDWSKALAKIPSSWDKYASDFLKEVEID